MSVKHIILGILSWKPSSGYEIKTEVEYKGRELGWGKVSFGSIYPKLKELELEGLVNCKEVSQTERQTKMYDLTNKGWAELSDWLRSNPTYPVVRDELLMKMSFWNYVPNLSIDCLIAHLNNRKINSEKMLEHLRDWECNDVSSIGNLAAYSFEYLKLQLETEIKWINQTIEKLLLNEQQPHKDPMNLVQESHKRYQKTVE
ncbi:PadR family transcriptional regulator [Gottfriedia sp. NPDC056225]|uniref:PadR family transcriptional regulator n=1 Tax=Gottfriedia sp. NPDC056225 TaxID=3345751 RepID=UPI0035DA9031